MDEYYWLGGFDVTNEEQVKEYRLRKKLFLAIGIPLIVVGFGLLVGGILTTVFYRGGPLYFLAFYICGLFTMTSGIVMTAQGGTAGMVIKHAQKEYDRKQLETQLNVKICYRCGTHNSVDTDYCKKCRRRLI